MIIVFFWNYLNHHQFPIADAMYEQLGDNFRFVATLPRDEKELKGGVDYSNRPYCVLAGESEEAYRRALLYAESADVCVFGACSQEYAIHRATLKPEALSFECGERWLKRGWLNVLSPVLRQWWMNYMRYYRKANFYKLCSSAFAAQDDEKLECYKGRHFKWGYFTSVNENYNENENICGAERDANVEAYTDVSTSEITPLMWCSRFLMWKHPELPILTAERLKKKGYRFHLDMYGSGEYEEASKNLAESLGLSDVVTFHGNVSNDQVHEAMRKAEIFLFTSDKHEGWGAVANESLSEGCVLVASDAIGSSPYLIEEGVNGFMFHSSKKSCSFKNPDHEALDSLCKKVEWLLEHPQERQLMRLNARSTMVNLWSPRKAAENLLTLIEELQNGKAITILEGPCSKA